MYLPREEIYLTNLPRKEKFSPFVIPIFISHQGCPHRCIFCNQVSITGKGQEAGGKVSAFQVQRIITEQLGWPRKNRRREVQVAFYGGSFTGLDKSLQEELLGAVKPFIQKGQVHSIRVSTRPDYIDSETPAFLSENSVKTVELGVQSMDPDVLRTSQRGHSVEQVEDAIGYLRQAHDILIGAQLMVGLPGETAKKLITGVQDLVRLRPDFVRIYPALVVGGSGLAQLYKQGEYKPLSLNKAVVLTAKMKSVFDECAIPVIRMGLQPSDSLADTILGGPFHPAFGELVKSRLLYKKIRTLLHRTKSSEHRKIICAASDQSIVRGQKNTNIKKLSARGLLDNVAFVFDSKVARDSVLIAVGSI
jgi:histone acetyltransferase (RNA polymerase elongator complex component)